MRLAIVIVALTGIAVSLVHMRRAELCARYEIKLLQLEQDKFRQKLWDQQNTMATILAPAAIGRRAEDMALEFVNPDPAQRRLMKGVAAGSWHR